ncbi:MAG: FemAB family PEP-CTERM system-associated protein [Magnetococcus sp. DMHC-6]
MTDSFCRVRAWQPKDEVAWDCFVHAHASGTFFHLSAWQEVLWRAFGHRSHYLLAEGLDGKILGILPLVRVRSRLFGDALISSPFCVYGGIVSLGDGVRAALEARACELAHQLGVDYLELRNQQPRREDWLRKDLYYTFRKPIDADPEKNLLAIPRKQRAEVRKGIRHGLMGRVDEDAGEACYRVYSESVRNLGTPVFSRNYFRILQEVFGSRCEPLVITYAHEPVSAVLSFYFRDEVLPYYGGGTAQARALGGTQFMYWELMRLAANRGARLFDFGRSKVGSGSFDFKKYYGFEPLPLFYEYHLVNSRQMPNLSPNNPKYQLFIKIWKHLPLSVSQRVGPWISKYLG